jgi:thiosulfate dehydrogenase [quinone] large subunit
MQSDTTAAVAGSIGSGDARVRAGARGNPRAFPHLGLRLVVGVNLLAHGLARIGDIPGFAAHLASDFAGVLPAALVRPFAFCVPPLELAIGLLVLLGVRLREVLLAASALLAALTFGACLIQRWEIVGLQLVYALAYWVLGAHLPEEKRP